MKEIELGEGTFRRMNSGEDVRLPVDHWLPSAAKWRQKEEKGPRARLTVLFASLRPCLE